MLSPDSKAVFHPGQPGGVTTVFLDVTSPFHPYNFCFLLWVTVPTSQLAVMASLQVITKAGIRLHQILHVYDCCHLPQQNPPQRHHQLFSQVWRCEPGTFAVTSPRFPRGGQAHTEDLHVPHKHSCSSLFPKKAEGLTTAGDTQLWPSHGCSSLFLKHGWGGMGDRGSNSVSGFT